MLPLLVAFQHADSAFPSGSFAFSNGIEGLASLGAPLDRDGLADTIGAILRHRWATADRVALVRAHRAESDLDAVAAVDFEMEAASVSEPLRNGSRRNGNALLASHVRLRTEGASLLQQRIVSGRAFGHLPVVQGYLWRALGIGEGDAVAISGYTVATGLITAAVRLGRIGALEAQTVLRSVLPLVGEHAERPIGLDARLESFLPWVDVAAARNTRAELRLFAN